MGLTPDEPLTNVLAVDGVASIAVGDTFIILWRDPASVGRWNQQNTQIKKLAKDFPDGVLVLSLILSSSDPPDAALRTRMQSDFRMLGKLLRKFIVVPIGNSMWLAVVRTLVRAVLLVSGESKRQAVASSIAEGLQLIHEERTIHTPNPARLEKMIDDLSRALGVKLERSGQPKS